MKKILGLDLGVTSIGWAVVKDDGNIKQIEGLGSRIIPLSTDDKDEFTSGNAISKNQERTAKRTQRKGYDRYQMRRELLISELKRLNMFPDESMFKYTAKELYGLRDKAVKEKISFREIGRILYHLNQKRGYKSSRSDENLDKKDTEYVAEVKNRHQKILEDKLTVGQLFYRGLTIDKNSSNWSEFSKRYGINSKLPYRIKQQVFPREAYIEEFKKICKTQQQFYPEIITNELIKKLRDNIIYYQRRLKSQKGLVSVCEFEGFYKNCDGKEIFVGPKVAPRSSPLFQVEKIWETINNITLKNKRGQKLELTVDQKKQIFNYLDQNEKLVLNDLFKILEIKKEDGWYGNKQLSKGIQGNTTRCQIRKCFDSTDGFERLFNFNIRIKELNNQSSKVDTSTGEIIKIKIVEPDFEKEPLYQLWHAIYSVENKNNLINLLINKFGIPQNISEKLSSIDFKKQGFGNKSCKAIRKILPYLMNGYHYSVACDLTGFNHSNSLTKEENLKRELVERLPVLTKNSLRQPVVEKILNQMINLVNAILEKYGNIDEIRIELARELKQNKEERNESFARNRRREQENQGIALRLNEEFGLRATRKNVQKWRLFYEIQGDESKANAFCIYCGKAFGITQALKGNEVDIEHIIPQSRLFDDSLNNKTLSHRKCNEEKGNMTAFDYMRTKSETEFNSYLERVEKLYKEKIINKAKRDKLLMAGDQIPQNFIDRQLRETQYISRKSKEILNQVCRNVLATSGSVTENLRRNWGWDTVLENLQIKKYKEAGLLDFIEPEEFQDEFGNTKVRERIKGWTKRDDHRHHAIDALTIACTTQGFIQRINTLNAEETRDAMFEEAKKAYDDKKSLLENYLFQQKPISTSDVEKAASQILVSFKPGKKVATYGKRKIKKNNKKTVVQTGIIIPRGPISEESVYGKIKTIQKEVPLKKLFKNPDLIVKDYIRDKIYQRINENENDWKKAFYSCKSEHIYLDDEKKVELTHATIFKDEYVIKYPLNDLKAKDIDSVVDNGVRKALKERLRAYNDNEREAFKDLDNNPVWLNNEHKIPIKSVRCFTGLSAVEILNKDDEGHPIGFVKPGNNHHIAIYIDEEGKLREHPVTLWHAVERKKYGLPVIIKNPTAIWDQLMETKNELPEAFLEKLPDYHWKYKTSMQQNEMFIFEMTENEIKIAIKEKNYHIIGANLFRVQKLGSLLSGWWFRHQYETSVNDKDIGLINKKKSNRVKVIQSIEKMNGIKVSINNLGEIIQIGD